MTVDTAGPDIDKMMRGFGQYLMKGRMQAIFSISLLSLIAMFMTPMAYLLSGTPVGLISLRRGPIIALQVTMGCLLIVITAWQTETRDRLAKATARLDALLGRGGLEARGGTDLFRYVEVPDAHHVFAHFARYGIYVRRFDWLARHLRIGLPATEAAELRLAEALSLLG